MSDLMKTVLLWAAVILLLGYLFRFDPITVVQNIVHAAQQMHNTPGG